MRLGPLLNAMEAHVSQSCLARRQPKRTVVRLLGPRRRPGPSSWQAPQPSSCTRASGLSQWRRPAPMGGRSHVRDVATVTEGHCHTRAAA